MVVVRMCAMYMLPLDPPVNMIILNDPLVEFFGTGQTLTKDLFFSGHTATLFILFLVSEKKIYKTIFLDKYNISCNCGFATTRSLHH